MSKLIRHLKYALFGYMKIQLECPHGKFWPGNYRAGQDTRWGCDECPLKLNITWSSKKDWRP